MIESHKHNNIDSPRINANDLTGPSVITANLAVSSRLVQPTIIQRGNYTLSTGVKFVAFPQKYSTATALQVLITADTATHQYLQGIVTSGFTVSGSGSDTGRWLAIGNK